MTLSMVRRFMRILFIGITSLARRFMRNSKGLIPRGSFSLARSKIGIFSRKLTEGLKMIQFAPRELCENLQAMGCKSESGFYWQQCSSEIEYIPELSEASQKYRWH